jgi:SAM-dependent methyltransferase
MAVNHNDHYHGLLLRQVPDGARRALDVGCGTGRFARLLAAQGLDVTGIDAHGDAVEAAREAGGGPVYRHADVREAGLPDGHYDFVSCIASLHHMPFETVLTLRRALAPGGVLAVLGLYAVRSPADFVWALAGVVPDRVNRLVNRFRPAPPGPGVQMRLVWPPPLSYADTRREAARLLPGATLRRLVFWRYLLVYREPGPPHP